MPRQRIPVTCRDADPNLLPPWATLPAVLLRDLVEREMTTLILDRLRIERKAGGHDGLGVVVALLVLFASGLDLGYRTFWQRMADWSRARGGGVGPRVQGQLAALVKRRSLCSPAALSRALSNLDEASARSWYSWLLVEVPGLLPLLTHPAVLMRDALGEGWHVFDFDPSATAFRKRELTPGDADIPPGRRRTTALAAPGYTGRKRGETQYVRAIVSHAGTGAWVFSRLSPGNGDARGDLVAGLDAVVSLVGRMGARTDRTLVRLDGAYGHVPAITSLQERGLPFVTRATQQLMNLPDVQARLTATTWVRIPDAEVSDLRSVAEIGKVTLEPGDDTRREGGSPYVPVTVRAVVSRMRKSSEAHRGVVLDGWQYEVFLTSLEPDAWPAADVVSTYHGRSTCENRYAQEDREFGLDRTFSFAPAGQELATTVGMAVWNMLIVQGFRTARPPEVTPHQALRKDDVDERESRFPPPQSQPPPPPDSRSVPPAEPPSEPVAQRRVKQDLEPELAKIPWDHVLAGRPGWHQDAAGGLRCPDGQALRLVSVGLGDRAGGQAAAYFATRAGTCRECPIRNECLRSTTGKNHKQIGITVPADLGERLHALLGRRPKQGPKPPPSPHQRRQSHRPSPPRGGHVLHPPEDRHAPGPWQVLHPVFLPAAARHRFRDMAAAVQVEIAIVVGDSPPPPPHALVAKSRRERRHGRVAWAGRFTTYDLPQGHTVALTAVGSSAIATALFGRMPRRIKSKTASA